MFAPIRFVIYGECIKVAEGKTCELSLCICHNIGLRNNKKLILIETKLIGFFCPQHQIDYLLAKTGPKKMKIHDQDAGFVMMMRGYQSV